MNLTHGLISADDKVQETPETWTSYISSQQWGDRIPHLQERDDGSQFWVVAGQPLHDRPLAETGALMPDRNQLPQRWDEVPPAAYDPGERLRAMDADGVDAQVLYPSLSGNSGEILGAIQDPELQLACVQAYNNWLIDAWATKSPRLIPQCLVPIDDPRAAATEAARAIELGHRGVILPGTPWNLQDVPHINDPAWDPLWNVCQEAEVPVCFHSGATPNLRLEAWDNFSPVLADAINAITGPVSSVPILANLLFSRILTRFPSLKYVLSDTSLAWGAYLIETADHQFERQRLHLEGYDLKPSELFRRQCYMTGWYDRAGLQVRSYLGVENILWQTNFPRATSTWPNTRQYIQRSFAHIPDDERQQILTKNPTTLYNP